MKFSFAKKCIDLPSRLTIKENKCSILVYSIFIYNHNHMTYAHTFFSVMEGLITYLPFF